MLKRRRMQAQYIKTSKCDFGNTANIQRATLRGADVAEAVHIRNTIGKGFPGDSAMNAKVLVARDEQDGCKLRQKYRCTFWGQLAWKYDKMASRTVDCVNVL